MAREALVLIIRFAGQAPFRLRPLSSNVSQHKRSRGTSSQKPIPAKESTRKVTLDASTALSILSALVAFIAALYARWAARAAHHANEITLHDPRFKAYSGVQRFAATLTTRGPDIPESELWQYRDAVDLAEFYYGEAIHAELMAHFREALKMMEANEAWSHARDEKLPERNDLSAKRRDIHRGLRDALYETITRMKEPLKVYSRASRVV